MQTDDEILPFYSFLAGVFLTKQEVSYSELSFLMDDFTNKTGIYISDDNECFSEFDSFFEFNDKCLFVNCDYNTVIYINGCSMTFKNYLYSITSDEVKKYFNICKKNKFNFIKIKTKTKVS